MLIVCCENVYVPEKVYLLVAVGHWQVKRARKHTGTQPSQRGAFISRSHMLRFGQHRNSSHRAAAGVDDNLHGDETIKQSKVVAIANCQVHPSPLILVWNKESNQWLIPKTQFWKKQICTELHVPGADRQPAWQLQSGCGSASVGVRPSTLVPDSVCTPGASWKNRGQRQLWRGGACPGSTLAPVWDSWVKASSSKTTD